MSYLFRSTIVSGIIVSAAMVGERSVWAGIVEIPASTNAFVLRSQANATQDVSQTFATKRLNDTNTRIGYLRFDLGALGGAEIVSATLWLQLTSYQSPTTIPTDTVRVWGLNDGAANGAITEANWSNADLTWSNQPLGAVGQTGDALPLTGKTTSTLATVTIDPTLEVKELPLNLSQVQSLLASDSNGEITLLVANNANNILSWASLANTNGYAVPTLRFELSSLTLVVDPETGAVQLTNPFNSPISFSAYRITSANGALNPAGWTPFSRQSVPGFPAGDGLGNGWEAPAATVPGDANNDGTVNAADYVLLRKLNSSLNIWRQSFGITTGPGGTSGELTEWYLNGASTLGAGGSISLGQAFQVSGAQSGVQFEYLSGNTIIPGTVKFESIGSGASLAEHGVPDPNSVSSVLMVLSLTIFRIRYWRRNCLSKA